MFFGGVAALTPLHYLKMNGFPNNYWGWGGEDDDISVRWDFSSSFFYNKKINIYFVINVNFSSTGTLSLSSITGHLLALVLLLLVLL